VSVTAEWFSAFFAGLWLDVQRSFWPAEGSESHARLLERVLELRPGSRVIDVPCGNGRLTVALARRGHVMTGVDFTPVFLAEARASAGDLPITFIERDMRQLDGLVGFDAAFNYWGSFGYFDDAGDEAVAAGVCRALAPGGRFAIDVNLIETLMPIFQAKGWFQVGDITVLEDRAFDFATSRIESDWTFIRAAAEQRRHTSTRLYSAHELAELLRRAGFTSVRFLDGAGEAPLTVASRRALVVATK
jgi:SAM-dependent methyltransferase